MNDNLKNFKEWYVRILQDLYDTREAGFVILMVAFPLLERYLREKSGVHEGTLKSNKRFYDELRAILPELRDQETARQFWGAYRHGLLHQVTISLKQHQGNEIDVWMVTHDIGDILYQHSNGDFFMHPVNFAEKVIDVIENDFPTFEGPNSPGHPLPTVRQVAPTILGTGAHNPP
ncbi:MAG: hypothetical protein JSW66_08940 [Phycisphaerales bacterium]|nr:MAG: hypothetical protein JSW66_08940 [Phycisphaerales bacterium]